MLSKKAMELLFLSALLFGLGCRTQEVAEVDDNDDASTVTEQESLGTDQPGDLNPVEAQTMVDDVTIGKKVGADGMISTEDQGDDFAPGENVHLTMNVADASPGTTVKVIWYGPGERKIFEKEKKIPAGALYLDFQTDEAPDKGFWVKGDYRAEVWIGDEKVNTQQFQIVDESDAGN